MNIDQEQLDIYLNDARQSGIREERERCYNLMMDWAENDEADFYEYMKKLKNGDKSELWGKKLQLQKK